MSDVRVPPATFRLPRLRVRFRNPAALLAPTLAYYVLFLLIPAGLFCIISFYQRSDTGFFDPVFTLKNYASALGDGF